MSMEDTGGHYWDSDDGGVTATVRKNFQSAASEITSGDAGGRAAGVLIGMVAAAIVTKRGGIE